MSGDLAKKIWQARCDGTTLPRSAVADVADRAAAYRVQEQAAAETGLTRAGWKVAATSQEAQGLLAVSQPIIGPVFKECLFDGKSPIKTVPAQAVAIECEFAFVMAKDLPATAVDRDAVLAAVDYAAPSIEVVGTRFAGSFKGAGELVCISDYAFNVGLVLGQPIPGWRNVDLKTAGAALTLNGKEIMKGVGAAVLGDPVTALVWAANEAAGIGRPLKAGDVITTGTMTGATLVHPGDAAVADYGPYGKFELGFN